MTLIAPRRRIVCPRCGKPFRQRSRRPLPYWRSPREVLLGKLQRDSDGKIQRDGDDGKILTHTDADPHDCCCGGEGEPCGDCDATPAAYTVTISGVTFCGCDGGIILVGSPNGTYTITQTANPCNWELTTSHSVEYNFYFGPEPNCTGEVTDTDDSIIRIRATQTGGNLVAAAWLTDSINSNSAGIFRVANAHADCMEPESFPNLYTISDCFTSATNNGFVPVKERFYGGTISFSPA